VNHCRALLHRLCGTPANLIIGLSIAFISIALVACAYSGAHQGISLSTQPSAQVVNTPASVQKCNIVQGPGRLKVPIADSGAEQAENCFWHAFQHCHPASLISIIGGIRVSLYAPLPSTTRAAGARSQIQSNNVARQIHLLKPISVLV